MKFLNLFFICFFFLSFSQTSFASVCFPPNAGIGPVMSSFKIIEPSANSSYPLNKPLLISWKGFLVQDNPNLLIQLWREDTCINKFPKRIDYKKSHVCWKNALTESGSGFYIRIFRADNECVYGNSSAFTVTE
ncbi:hypothetical protein C2G38_2031064 [Gigaspora rosea]|uniref:Uncharacterized protein n=1 Tax=Gigaspora rosea TaxID=44941 RepID=A0A397VWR3_9GLOM|nr:hypothetical protein C2G38_2031064 [Gigaspora rosea]CAG8454061.1 23769_t:CDS:2 [Gigaspora rosea]